MPDSKASPLNPPNAVGFWEAFRFWLKLGFISFGGPAGQIAIMHQELVENRRWISEKRFLHALNYCMVLPGPEAQQLATYLGWLMHRTMGGIVAGSLFVLPSLFILIFLTWVYIAYGDLPIVSGIFYGIKPAVTAIVFQAAVRIGSRTLSNYLLWLLAIISFTALFIFNVPFPAIILMAALIGYGGGIYFPDKFTLGGITKNSHETLRVALIDDHTPSPEHARFKLNRFFKVLIFSFLLWAAPIGILIYQFGIEGTYTQMGLFFTKAALLTFGGAYAVLPYVYQAAVEHYGWLSSLQMMDGLALGETTPGPLIMIVAFVGFIGGYTQEVLGTQHLFLSGALAAVIVTWFTFLPSFVFILLGGPLIERAHNYLEFTAPLTAITATIVGVIFELAVFFGYHVLWPAGFIESLDWRAALIAIASFVALFRYKANVTHVICVSAVLGALIKVAL